VSILSLSKGAAGSDTLVLASFDKLRMLKMQKALPKTELLPRDGKSSLLVSTVVRWRCDEDFRRFHSFDA
jgi:hypothetical protein